MKTITISVAIAVWVATSAPAFAQDKSVCVSAYEQGQVDRRAGHFDAARGDFATCTEDSCPSVVRERCLQFARDLEAAQPTMLIAVHDASGHDVAGARISVDGGPPAPIPAAALRIDPGEHTVRVETEIGGAEQHIVLREGEKDRRIDIPVGEKSVAPTIPAGPETAKPAESGKPVAAWVMTIAAGVSLGGAGVLSATGWGIYSNLSSTCQHSCSDDQVAPLRVLWPAAFVALGIGAVAAIVGGVLFATHGRHVEHAALWVGPSGLAGSF